MSELTNDEYEQLVKEFHLAGREGIPALDDYLRTNPLPEGFYIRYIRWLDERMNTQEKDVVWTITHAIKPRHAVLTVDNSPRWLRFIPHSLRRLVWRWLQRKANVLAWWQFDDN